MMDFLTMSHNPLCSFFYVTSVIAHISSVINEHTVSGGAAKRIYYDDFPIRIFLLQSLSGSLCILNRFCHAAAKRDMKQVPAGKQKLS